MKIMTKLNLLSAAIVVVMTASVLGVGTLIVNDILYRYSDQVLRLELANAGKEIFQQLNRSGVRAAADAAAGLQRQLRRKDGLRTANLFIIEAPDYRIVYHPDLPSGHRLAFDFVEQMFRREAGTVDYNYRDTQRHAVFVTVRPVNWLLSLSLDKEEMLEKRGDFLREIGIVTLVILCLNALGVSLFGRRLTRRLGAALDCVKHIEQGDLSARISAVPVHDEIGRLQEGINAMSERIAQRTAEQQAAESALRAREARIRRLFESNIIGVFFWDMRGDITDANDAFLDIVGYERGELQAGVLRWTDLTPPEYRAGDMRHAEEVRRSGTCAPYEKEYWRKDGSRVPILLGAARFEDEEAMETGVAFVLDLSERKRAEEALRKARDELEMRVQERTADLKRANQQLELEVRERRQAEEVLAQRSQALARSNAELEQLAYVASHDLQEPLRMVASYVQLLESRYHDRLDADGRDFIEFAVDGAKRMQALIDALLSYSRLGTRAEPLQPTDCGVVVARVLRLLRLAIEESGAQVSCDPLPVVMADASQLAQLFQNLIANAIKFRGERPPRVRIQAEAEDGFWRFAVQDNGIGIDPAYAERIFEMFQRLHARREYPGTGMGLAICKKIVERHGGRIWVESTPGVGSVFRFTLPASRDGNRSEAEAGVAAAQLHGDPV
jgi:PAS domain S-box-containing protein